MWNLDYRKTRYTRNTVKPLSFKPIYSLKNYVFQMCIDSFEKPPYSISKKKKLVQSVFKPKFTSAIQWQANLSKRSREKSTVQAKGTTVSD